MSSKATPLPPVQSVLQRVSPGLERQLLLMVEECVACGICVKQCTFLQHNGTPRDIALRYSPDNPGDLTLPFACHLCGLCGAVCPKSIQPSRLFLEMRRETVSRWHGDFPQHKRILAYERRGISSRYALHALPEDCTSVFFPGCTLPGVKPALLLRMVTWLRTQLPDMGVVLDCCSKPSHDLGRQLDFSKNYLPLRDLLLNNGVTTIYVCCPNCFKVFSEYGAPLQVRMVYELLAEIWSPPQTLLRGEVAVHDPCPLRDSSRCHDAVRSLVRQTGLRLRQMDHERDKTICCGEGGSVSLMVPEFAQAWTDLRAEEAGDAPVVTYCAGCMLFLRQKMRTHHLLDLLFFPERTWAGKEKTASAPMTYANRLRLKGKLRKLRGLARFPQKQSGTK